MRVPGCDVPACQKRDDFERSVYIAVDIREDGSKEVLAYTVAPTEYAHVWKALIEDIYARGEVLRFISDGLTGIKDSIHSVFPKAKYQTCFIHVARNISHRVRVSDCKEICQDLKSLYRVTDKVEAEQALETFVEKWKKSYAKVPQSLKDNPVLFTFYDFTEAIRRSIYSTNLIESFNKRIKRYSKRKEQCPNEASLDRFLVTQFEAYNQQFATRCHIGFDQARGN